MDPRNQMHVARLSQAWFIFNLNIKISSFTDLLIEIKKSILLLRVVALCAWLQTSTCPLTMLWINCPIFKPCSVPYLAPNIPFSPHPYHTSEELTDIDDINMPDSS
jgi:hypothetical protein